MSGKKILTGSVLIVDDTPTNLEVISHALGQEGYQVAVAISGERALQQVQRRQPDLILLDIMMPGIDGFETCKQLKTDPNTCDIPVIFMTALADAESKIQGLNLGAVDYITKPFQEREVLARVKTHLQLRFLTQNLAQEVERKTAELRDAHLQIVQREKMSALGNLVAGVAHEINNPVGFIAGNIKPALDYLDDIFSLLDLVEGESASFSLDLYKKMEEIDINYVREDLKKLIGSMQEGTNRIKEISQSLRNFARSDDDRAVAWDVRDGIETTLTILKHRLKANELRPEIEVVKNYGDLPDVSCYVGLLNQVFMNLLSNAIDAVEEANRGLNYREIFNKIEVETAIAKEGGAAIIAIRDNGIGMSADVIEKIFTPLFTTKEIGKGTGLGLAIARQIVEEKHGGTIEVNSQLGKGTEFILNLPLMKPQPRT